MKSKKLEKLSGMWKEKDQNGIPFLSGKYKDKFFFVLKPNDKKKDNKSPDFVLYKSPLDKKDEEDDPLEEFNPDDFSIG